MTNTKFEWDKIKEKSRIPTGKHIIVEWFYNQIKRMESLGSENPFILFSIINLEKEIPQYGINRYGITHTANYYNRQFRLLKERDSYLEYKDGKYTTIYLPSEAETKYGLKITEVPNHSKFKAWKIEKVESS